MTLTDTLLSFSRDTRFEVLPPAVVHEARRYVLDALGCALGGHAVEKGRIAAAYAARLAGAPEAGIVGSMARVSMPAAAFANAELVNALDHDSIPHVVPVTLPPVLAAGQATHASGKELVTAMVVAHEIGNRIGRASSAMIKSLMETGSTPEAFGINNEALIGGALGTSSLLGQSREQAAQALGLAAYFCSLPVARDWEEAMPKSMVKYTPVGLMAQNAVHAALLAGDGFTGNPHVLDAPHGFPCFLRTGRWEPAIVTQGLGADWTFLEQQYKPWPCCRFFHSQLDLLAQLVERHALAPADVESIDTHGPRFVANPEPYTTRTQTDVQFSLPFCMALVAHGVAPDARWQSAVTLADPALHRFAQRVRMHADPRSLQAKAKDPRSWSARLEITLTDGRRVDAQTEHARGTNGTTVALTDDDLQRKFLSHAERVLGADRARLALDSVWQLERMTDVAQLTGLLAPAG